MNPLLKSSQPSQPNFKDLASMMRGMTPDKARNEVESLVNSGCISKQQFEQLKSQAQGICALLGIK